MTFRLIVAAPFCRLSRGQGHSAGPGSQTASDDLRRRPTRYLRSCLSLFLLANHRASFHQPTPRSLLHSSSALRARPSFLFSSSEANRLGPWTRSENSILQGHSGHLSLEPVETLIVQRELKRVAGNVNLARVALTVSYFRYIGLIRRGPKASPNYVSCTPLTQHQSLPHARRLIIFHILMLQASQRAIPGLLHCSLRVLSRGSGIFGSSLPLYWSFPAYHSEIEQFRKARRPKEAA